MIQHVEVPIITNKECENMYRRAGYIEDIPNIFVCAGLSKGTKDSCEVRPKCSFELVDTDSVGNSGRQRRSTGDRGQWALEFDGSYQLGDRMRLAQPTR